MSQSKTKIQIIEETVAFYGGDLSRRSTTNTGCLYKHHEGKECAFQRCVAIDLSPYEGSYASAVFRKTGENLQFKEGYEGHDHNFWDTLQNLHDTDNYWDLQAGAGLSDEGRYRVNYLKEKYANS